MKIHFVTEEPGWILHRISETYAKHLPNTTVGQTADESADINIYVHYALFKNKTPGIDIGYFTHRESYGEKAEIFDRVKKEVDWCIAMCKRTAKLLPKHKTSINLVPPDIQFMGKEKLILGVVGTEKSTGRKRYHYLEQLRKIDGIEIRMTNGKYDWNEMPDFYRSIDYLLILSDNEGGPVPLVEALAMHKPVITSAVGFSDEYTAIKYNDLNELEEILKRLVIKKDAWEKSAAEIYDICQKLYSEKIKKESRGSLLGFFRAKSKR